MFVIKFIEVASGTLDQYHMVAASAGLEAEDRKEQMDRIIARERLIVALDLDDVNAARRMVVDLDGVVNFFKIGLSLQLASGVDDLIRELMREGKKVFLDYKYYDIEETLRRAVGRAAEMGVSFLTVHGTSKLIKAADAARVGSQLKLFTVTILTSMDMDDVREMGYTDQSIEEIVVRRSMVALHAGCDGVIASPLEARKIKEMTDKLLVTTPGIREAGATTHDQKRFAAPDAAVREGADYLVVGRSITQPDNPGESPREVALRMVEKMQLAFDEKQ
jgi:orotidine-5'-phosphate decarboxylase